MINFVFHMIYIGIIIIILLNSYVFPDKKKEIKENIPTYEYYEWKRLYYKMLVLNLLKEYYSIKKSKLRNWNSANF